MTQYWKLSHFDTFSLGMVIKGAWIYRELPEASVLQASLDAVLQPYMYPQLRGRFTEEGKSLVWDDENKSDLKFTTADLSRYSKENLKHNARLTWSLVKEFDIKGFKKGSVGVFDAVLATLKDGAILRHGRTELLLTDQAMGIYL